MFVVHFLRCHFVYQCTAIHNGSVVDIVLRELLAVERDVCNIFVCLRESVGYDSEGLAVKQVNGYLLHLRSAEYVLAAHWVDGIESHSREHVPCRHLTAVVVAAKTVYCRTILSVEYLANEFLSA